MAAVVMHVDQTAHQFLIGILTHTAGCAPGRPASTPIRSAAGHPRPTLGVFVDQDAGLLQQVLVAVGALHARHGLQPLAEYGVRVWTAPSAERPAGCISRARRYAIAMQDIVVRNAEVEIAAGRGLFLPPALT